MAGLLAPWTDHPSELVDLRVRLVHLINRLGRIEDELTELHNDLTAIAEKIIKENP